jgi:hypothetical protein
VPLAWESCATTARSAKVPSPGVDARAARWGACRGGRGGVVRRVRVVTHGRVQLELRDGEPGPVLGRGAGFWLRGTGVRALRTPVIPRRGCASSRAWPGLHMQSARRRTPVTE